jgi:hypothetical protein
MQKRLRLLLPANEVGPAWRRLLPPGAQDGSACCAARRQPPPAPLLKVCLELADGNPLDPLDPLDPLFDNLIPVLGGRRWGGALELPCS